MRAAQRASRTEWIHASAVRPGIQRGLDVTAQTLSEQDEDAAEMHEAQIVVRRALVAHHQPPKVAQPREEPLDLPPPLEPA